MNTPPLLLAAALLLWGWQTDLLWLAAPMAVVLEGARLTRSRWDFAQPDLNRLWNLSLVLFLGALLYLLASNDNGMGKLWQAGTPNNPAQALEQSARSMFLLFQWMPLFTLPIMLAQSWGTMEQIPFETFSWLLRRRLARQRKRGGELAPAEAAAAAAGINISFPYLALCLVGASATNRREIFLAAVVVIVGWALWSQRNRRFSAAAWAACFTGALVLAAGGWLGMRELTQWVERVQGRLIQQWLGSGGFGPRETRTALGQVGGLQLSGEIVMRLETEGEAPPALLREASYSIFRSPVWLNPSKDFLSVSDEGDGVSWNLLPRKIGPRAVTIYQNISRGSRLLALPSGTGRLEGLWPLLLIETNNLGAVRTSEDLNMAGFIARYDGGAGIDIAPARDDQLIPPPEQPGIARVAAEIGLEPGMPAREAVAKIHRFFAGKFEYATWFDTGYLGRSNRTALSIFLEDRRKGHCEYFASATTLLLRHAGVPARYAVGWSVQEGTGNQRIVRARHAHAWTLAWLDGVWREVDNTPGMWSQVEAARSSWLEPLRDAWSRLMFEFNKWRYGQTGFRTYALLLIAPVVGVLLWQVVVRRQWRRSGERERPDTDFSRSGLDSEFFLIERRLVALGLARLPGETLSAWLRRLRSAGQATTEALPPLLALHNRLRFDPAGLAPEERGQLRQAVQTWLAAHR